MSNQYTEIVFFMGENVAILSPLYEWISAKILLAVLPSREDVILIMRAHYSITKKLLLVCFIKTKYILYLHEYE